MPKPKPQPLTKRIFRHPSGQTDLFEKSLEEDLEEHGSAEVECLGIKFPNDEARRAYFLEKLREQLHDPAFRKNEGFPVGKDEDILALSDPPFYTACPNPFVKDFICHYGRAYDPKNDRYSRPPFAADVSEGKNDLLYNAHSYHTKVPHKAVMRYILHYTRPGDIVFDGFAGTGMTAVAAQLCSQPDPSTKKVLEGQIPGVVFGPRYTILCDLSPEATFISHSLNTPYRVSELGRAVRKVTSNLEGIVSDLYRTEVKVGHGDPSPAEIIYTIWSDRVACPECSVPFTYSDVAVNSKWTKEFDSFRCPSCDAKLSTRKLIRYLESKWDPILGRVIQISQQVPVLLSCAIGTTRYRKNPTEQDQASAVLGRWPNDLRSPLVALDRLDRYFKDSLHLRKYTHVHHLYTERTWFVLASLASLINGLECDARTRQQLLAIFTSTLPRLDRLNRYMPDHQRHVGPLVGTLYVSWLTVEISALNYWKDKAKVFLALRPLPGNAIISTGSSTALLGIPDNSVDYIFTDPPFGHNLQYGELNQRAEAWLGVFTNKACEAVVSDAQKKDLYVYQSLMAQAFREAYRILKPGRWMTVEFHNSRNAVWNCIQEAISNSGFVIADVRTLDKKKGTTNQLYYSAGAVKQDLAISAYKPNGGLEGRFELEKGTEDGVWDFVRTHLRQLPVFVTRDGNVEIVAERQAYLLYDRMVAFHVQRGVTVPLSAAEFYAGLAQRFSGRDGMYFLPEQAAEYDKKRMAAREVLQLELFVSNESTAIQWLKQQLTRKPQTFQELHPQFMKEIAGWVRYEKPVELREMLEQNFLCYDGSDEVPSQIHSYLSTNFRELRNLPKSDSALKAKAEDRWYVPDPNKGQDLEKVREKALLREFEEYLVSTQKKLKVFRLEAVRAGFKRAWQQTDYTTIVNIARKIPEDILQEDQMLLMWYTNAVTRSGTEQ
jgi:DNA modification methylase